MSVLSGYGKGARRRRGDERYYAAVGRQLLLHDAGGYQRHDRLGIVWHCTPAPVEEFLRAEHRGLTADPGIDLRAYGRDSQRT